MDALVIVLIVIGALIVIGVLLFGGRRARERRFEAKREEAGELRTQAEEAAGRAQVREETARREAAQATADRELAEERARRADDIDPDTDSDTDR
jgi:FtsZ-interacting cell division protein ZipA